MLNFARRQDVGLWPHFHSSHGLRTHLRITTHATNLFSTRVCLQVVFFNTVIPPSMANRDGDTGQFDSGFRLHRTKRTHDLPSLLSESGDAAGGKKACRSLQRRSTNSGSENSDILYMAKPRTRDRQNSSLSLISNQSTPRLDGIDDGDGGCNDTDAQGDAADESFWDVIDREIYEWQYVCRTGHPYWWSPKARLGHLNMSRSKLCYEPNSRIWVGEVNELRRDEYNARRRAVSDSFLKDPNTVDDMAHMVAVQLLSSCFTLPPEFTAPVSSQNISLPDMSRSPGLSTLDAPLISSLRMHTRYRYSPSFGHQGRNTSPVRLVSDWYNSHSPSSASPLTVAGMQTPDIGTSDTLARRRRVHRALHVTEGSATNCSLDSHTDEYLKFCTNANLNPRAKPSRLHQKLSEDNNSEGRWGARIGRAARQETVVDSHYRDRIASSEDHCNYPRLKHESNLTTRSEPHHDFMQPVKEIVAKRWQNLRRRLGGSLHSNMPLTEFREASSAARSRASSPAAESHGKERRRRARASGDISSYESTPHYNSPVSSHLSPTGSGASSPPQTDYGTVPTSIAVAEPLAHAISSVLDSKLEDVGPSHDSASFMASPSLETCQGCQIPNSPDENLSGSMHSQSIAEPDHGARQISTVPSPPSSIRGRSRSRQRRKSMLSEVFTADDLGDETATNMPNAMTSAQPSSRNETESSSGMARSDSGVDLSRMTTRKPRLSRTSTSGTQVFSPSDEGVEIDGLPVGLCRHAWDRSGKRRERSYL